MILRRARLAARLRGLPLQKLQLIATESIFLFFFISVWKYKIWYLATAGVVGLTALLVALPALRVRHLLGDITLIVVYFVYLFVAAGWSDYAALARYWVKADAIGIVVFALFWIAARNNGSREIEQSFVRVLLLISIPLMVTYNPTPLATRFGGYTIGYIPMALPFVWAVFVRGGKRLSAGAALAIGLGVLLLSRSRAPLFTGLILLGLAVLLIGKGIAQRVKLAAGLLTIGLFLGALLFSYKPTRFALLSFYARISHNDVLTSEFYIAGEQQDDVRTNLRKIVREQFWDVQPFGAGYVTTKELYARRYWDVYSLHDIYQTWAFEGGLICLAIALAMLYQSWRALRFARRFGKPDEAVLARCIELAILGILILGLFHQVHHGPVFYSLLGMALGLRARVRARLHEAPRPVAHPTPRRSLAPA